MFASSHITSLIILTVLSINPNPCLSNFHNQNVAYFLQNKTALKNTLNLTVSTPLMYRRLYTVVYCYYPYTYIVAPIVSWCPSTQSHHICIKSTRGYGFQILSPHMHLTVSTSVHINIIPYICIRTSTEIA